MSNGANPLPVRWDFTAYRGDAFMRGLRIIYTDDAGVSQVLDTTGWSGRMAIKATKTDTTALLHSDAGEITITTGLLGTAPDQYTLDIFIPAGVAGPPATGTSSLPSGLVGWYDIELTDTSGRPITYFTGRFCVEGDVT